MREILFRGKRKDNGEWIQGYFARLVDACKGRISYRVYGTAEIDCGEFYPDCFEVDHMTVGQYTGLKDKKGNRIFEGDILKVSSGFICEVKWDGDNARFLGYVIGPERLIAYVGRESKSEVIGNIHDNPELAGGIECLKKNTSSPLPRIRP